MHAREVGHHRAQAGLGLGRERRDVDALVLGAVRDDLAGAARRGDEREAATAERAGAGEQLAGDDEVLEGVDADDGALTEDRVDDAVVAHERAGVRLRDLGAAFAASDLERHYRLAGRECPSRDLAEALRVADRLDEQQHDLGVLVVDEVVDHVGHRQHRLVAHGDEQAEARVAHPRLAQHRARERPALQHDADRPLGDLIRQRQTVRGDSGGDVDEAVAVRAEHGDAALAGEGAQLLLEPRTLLADLAEPGREHHGRADAGIRDLAHDVEHRTGGHHHDREVGRFGQVGDGAVRLLVVHDSTARVDEVDGAREPALHEVRVERAGPAGLVRRAHEHDGCRVEELSHALDGEGGRERRRCRHG